MMNPTPTAAEAKLAAQRWKDKRQSCPAQINAALLISESNEMADFILSLPTPGASTAAERAGIKGPVWVRSNCLYGLEVWEVYGVGGNFVCRATEKETAEAIAAALNAPAAAPVAGLFEGGSWVSWETLRGDDRHYDILDDTYYYIRLEDDHREVNPVQGYQIGEGHQVFCDRHGLPLPVPAPTAGGEGGA